MQSKISRRQKIAMTAIAVIDVLMLAAAAVLDSLRDSLPNEYMLTDSGDIVASHPYDRFGIVVAAALALVAGIFAFAVIDAINSEANKRRGRIIGFSVLFAVSLIIVMFSYLWVRGSKPEITATYDYTDSELSLMLFEERYPDDFGTLTVFVSDKAHNKGIALVAATDIHRHSKSSDDYMIDWIYDNALRITFLDGTGYRSVQIDLARILPEEQLRQYLESSGNGADAHDHEHDHG